MATRNVSTMALLDTVTRALEAIKADRNAHWERAIENDVTEYNQKQKRRWAVRLGWAAPKYIDREASIVRLKSGETLLGVSPHYQIHEMYYSDDYEKLVELDALCRLDMTGWGIIAIDEETATLLARWTD